MYIGIIEEIGVLKKITITKDGRDFLVSASVVLDDLKIGDDISINGISLTVKKVNQKSFLVMAYTEILEESNLDELTVSAKVNLERPPNIKSRLRGHFHFGTADTLGIVVENEKLKKKDTLLTIGISPDWMRFCLPFGFISINGISLKITSIMENFVKVRLSDDQVKKTNLGILEKGETVNIEVDIIGKYLDRLISMDDEAVSEESFLGRIINWGFGES